MLPIVTNPFQIMELRHALQVLKVGKASGVDDVLPDLWKALSDTADALVILLDLCNKCWNAESLPDSWYTASIATIFKKGDDSLPANYRPISLLTVGYKILATMIHARIVKGGSEQRLRDSQFGFRRKRSVIDAVFIVQQLIYGAWEGKDTSLSIIFLDWSKAFDKVDPQALIVALRRFGIPEKMVRMIGGIYAKRSFVIKDQGHTSNLMEQGTGIAQGCPLSPYLFVIMLTMVFADVEEALRVLGLPDEWVDVAYADDVALSADNPVFLQIVLDCLIRSAAVYGLKPNWDKTVHCRNRH